MKSHLRFLILPPGCLTLIRNSAGMETKYYSSFSIASILLHDSFVPNRGHFIGATAAHQAEIYPSVATMSLAERLAGLCFRFMSLISPFFLSTALSLRQKIRASSSLLTCAMFNCDDNNRLVCHDWTQTEEKNAHMEV